MRTVVVVTVISWAVMLVDMVPGVDVSADMARLTLVLAGVGSVLLAQIYVTRPVAEVYLMGHAAGYRQGRIDEAVEGVNPDRVVVQLRHRG